MYVIVGLGNPGETYNGTRHNVGFEMIDKLCFDFKIKMKNNRRLRSHVGEGKIENTDVFLIKPMTYMNLSGEAVRAVLNYYKLPNSSLIVVYDDVALYLGDVRVRERGSAGGQKGMVNIIACLGTDEFSRVRIGIDPKPEGWALSDYVLSRFRKAEWESMIQGVTKAGDAVQMIIKEGCLPAMNFYNQRKPTKKVVTPLSEGSVAGVPPAKRRGLGEPNPTAASGGLRKGEVL